MNEDTCPYDGNCGDYFNCCNCGGENCGCAYCWSCHACSVCKGEDS